MKSYNVKYTINSKDNCEYIILSDFHDFFDIKLANSIRDNSAKYVIIAGDLLNGWEWTNIKKLQEVKRFIDIIKENHKVIIGLGNHDLWKLDDEGFKNFKNLESDNVYSLFNESCVIDNNCFTNFLPDKTCYSYPQQHKKETVDKIINTYDKRFSKPDEKYINHLVSHNPYHFNHDETIDIISKNYDIIETGHFHDGWIPTKFLDQNYDICIDKNFNECFRHLVLHTNSHKCSVMPRRNLQRGLIYMYKEGYYVLLPNNSIYYYDKINNQYTKSDINFLEKSLQTEKVPAIVISGAINTFKKIGMFYPYVTNLRLTTEETYNASAQVKKLSK